MIFSKVERLEKSKAIAEKKLILLYILSILNNGVNNVDLTKTVLDGRYMDFFALQQYLNELISGGYVSSVDEPSPLYLISDLGRALIQDMTDLIPTVEKNRINRTIGAIKRHIKDSSAVTADYIPEDENRCVAKLKIEENGRSMLSVEIAAGSKDDARKICKNWEDNTHEIYTKIIEILTSQPKGHDV